jgi:putative ABC transport system ATP-binding protein
VADNRDNAMEKKRPLYFWVLKRHRLWQASMLVLILLSISLQILPLELQKRIVNIAIKSGDFGLLIRYCIGFLISFIGFGFLKFIINMMQAQLGQTILFEIRRELYSHLLQLPLNFFRDHPPGTVINALTGELSSVGHFIGTALTVPVTLGLTLVGFGAYMVYLNPLLAAVSLSIYPVELFLIPYLQKRYNIHNRRRINTQRRMSDKINESVSGIVEIQGNALFFREQESFEASASSLLATLKQLFVIKYAIKMINNLFQNFGPFLLFILGGFLTIKGEFSLGSLIACLSAYGKVYDPWKEMIEFYQAHQDALVRYNRVMETFNLQPDFLISPTDRDIFPLKGEIKVRHLNYATPNNIELLHDISFDLHPGEHMAIVGFSGSGKTTLAMVLGQLYAYQRGEVLFDGHHLNRLTKKDISCNMGYVPQHPYLFDTSVGENIMLGTTADCPGPRSTGPSGEALLNAVGLTDDILRFALENRLSPPRKEQLGERIIKFRWTLRRSLGPDLFDKIELFDASKFLNHTDLYENLVFSDSLGKDLARKTIAGNRAFRGFLGTFGLDDALVRLGYQIASQSAFLLKNLADDPSFFEATPITITEIAHYETIVERYPNGDLGSMRSKDKTLFFSLALTYVPARHKVAAVPGQMRETIVAFRKAFLDRFIKIDFDQCTRSMNALRAGKPMDMDQISFGKGNDAVFCPGEYLLSKSVLENLLFGCVKTEYASASPRIRAAVIKALESDPGMYTELIGTGLDFRVGSKGDRLSGGQKQKLALARALGKQPPILILDEATASLDNVSQKKVQAYITDHLKGRCTVVSVIHRTDLLPLYDKIIVMKEGKLVEMGKYHDLMEKKGIFYELVQGR